MVTSTVRPNEDNSISWAGASPHYAQVNDVVNYPDAGGDSSYVSANKGDANDTEQFGYENPSKVGKIRNVTMHVRGRRAGGAGDVQISHYTGAWESNVNAGLGGSNGWGDPRSVDYARGSGKGETAANGLLARHIAPNIITIGEVFVTVTYLTVTHTRKRKVMGVQDPWQVMKAQDMNIKAVAGVI